MIALIIVTLSQSQRLENGVSQEIFDVRYHLRQMKGSNR